MRSTLEAALGHLMALTRYVPVHVDCAAGGCSYCECEPEAHDPDCPWYQAKMFLNSLKSDAGDPD